MPWPFVTPVEPVDLVAPGTAVPTVETEISPLKRWITGAEFYNSAGDPVTVTLKNTAGAILYKTEIQPGQMPPPYSAPFRPTTGLRWVASAAGVIAHIYGY